MISPSDLQAPAGYTIGHPCGSTATGAAIWQAHSDRNRQRSLLLREAHLIPHRNPEQSDRIREAANQLTQLRHSSIPPIRTITWQGDRLLSAQVMPAGQSLQGYISNGISHGEARDNKLTLTFLQTLIHSILDVLIYLQNRTPPVSHREICPQNLWVNDQGQASLVNFRLNGEKRPDQASACITAFVAPEILAAGPAQPSSDLYSLGLTLIALVCQMQPKQIQQMRTTKGRFGFQRFVPVTYSLDFIHWLETLVQVEHSDRFPHATAALQAFNGMVLERRPSIDIQVAPIILGARHLNESLTHRLSIRNRIPDTHLEGKWQLAIATPSSAANDNNNGDSASHSTSNSATHSTSHNASNSARSLTKPPQSFPSWLSIEPRQFKTNDLTCHLSVDTHHLRANQTFRVTLSLISNADCSPILIPLEVHTAQFQWNPLPWRYMILVAIAAFMGGSIATRLVHEFGFLGWGSLGMSLILSSMLGGAIRASNVDAIIRYSGMVSLVGLSYGTVMNGNPHVGEVGMVAYIIGAVWGIVLGFVVSLCQHHHRNRGVGTMVTWMLASLVALMAALWGIHWTQPLPSQFDLSELSMIGVDLTTISMPGLPQTLLYGSSYGLGGLILVFLGGEVSRWIRYHQAEHSRLSGTTRPRWALNPRSHQSHQPQAIRLKS